MRVAFYAPLKAPDHEVPSGDRAIARLLLAALRSAGAARGWEVDLASRFRSFDGRGDQERQARLRDIGTRLADRLIRRYREHPAERRPRLWFTYHLYHKAPDWLGPAVSERLGIPYVVAEASHAAKQAGGKWRIGHDAAVHAIRLADAVLVLNRDDAPGVRSVAADPSRIVSFPPFLGPRGVPPEEGRSGSPEAARGGRPAEAEGPEGVPAAAADVARLAGLPSGVVAAPAAPGTRTAVAGRWDLPVADPWLLCVAMMRGGRKLASFEVLAEALARPGLAARPWHLVLAGDGPERPAVEAVFAKRLPATRVTFTGRVEDDALARLYASAGLFVWPAVGEPMGMAMLEAQGHGLPVVAGRTRGVPDLVRHEETGLLVREGDADAFAGAVRALLEAPERRRRMGDAARVRVAREHSSETATARLGDLVETLVRGRSPKARPVSERPMEPQPLPERERERVRGQERGRPPPGANGTSRQTPPPRTGGA
ncbi:MAG: glycosyltransferase family 4 protein [Immundisolibacterales bacterium]|nr:glycosyltransferase family 4 protein [Immundisolibacterales bacterium]